MKRESLARPERLLDLRFENRTAQERMLRRVAEARELVRPEARRGRLIAVPRRLRSVDEIHVPRIAIEPERLSEARERRAALVPEMLRPAVEHEPRGGLDVLLLRAALRHPHDQ